MITKRIDREGYTEIRISNESSGPWSYYGIVCMDVDIVDDTRVSPTATISLLTATGVTVEHTRRLAAEYAEVADVAEALQTEKRAAYTK